MDETREIANYIKKKGDNISFEPIQKSIAELEEIVAELKGLAKLREDADKAYSRNLVQIRIDQGYTNAYCKYYIDPFHERKRKYEEALVKLRFTINSSLYSSGLNKVEMPHYNYNFNIKSSSKNRPCKSDTDINPCYANAIAEEYYQIPFLSYWSKQGKPDNTLGFTNLSYDDIKHGFFQSLTCLKFSDVAVTRESKGKSRVEYYIDRIKRKFKKYGLIDSKGKLTNFGIYSLVLAASIKRYDLDDKRKEFQYYYEINTNVQAKALSKDLEIEIFKNRELKNDDWFDLFFSEEEIKPLKEQINNYIKKAI